MQNKNLSLFLYSQILSSFGYNLLFSAINFYALDLTGSATKFATVMLSGIVAKAIFLQIAGLISDNFDKKLSFVAVDFAYAFLSMSLILFSSSNLGYLSLIVASIAVNAIRSIAMPITKTIIPAIVDKNALLGANSYEVSNDKLGRIFGPSVALGLLAVFGFRSTVIFSFVIYVITLALKLRLEINRDKVVYNNSSFIDIIKQFKEGFVVTLSNRRVFLLLLNAMLTQMFFHSFIYTVFPVVLHGLKTSEMSFIMNILSKINMANHSSIWKALNSWIQLGGALGVLISIFFISRNKEKIKEDLGLALGNFGIAIAGLLISAIVFYFKISNMSTFNFVMLMFFLNVPLVFFFNLFTIFFSVYYQKRIEKNKLGRFTANFLFLFALTSSLGTYIYGVLASSSWLYPILFLAFGSILKIAVHSIFIYEGERDE